MSVFQILRCMVDVLVRIQNGKMGTARAIVSPLLMRAIWVVAKVLGNVLPLEIGISVRALTIRLMSMRILASVQVYPLSLQIHSLECFQKVQFWHWRGTATILTIIGISSTTPSHLRQHDFKRLRQRLHEASRAWYLQRPHIQLQPRTPQPHLSRNMRIIRFLLRWCRWPLGVIAFSMPLVSSLAWWLF